MIDIELRSIRECIGDLFSNFMGNAIKVDRITFLEVEKYIRQVNKIYGKIDVLIAGDLKAEASKDAVKEFEDKEWLDLRGSETDYIRRNSCIQCGHMFISITTNDVFCKHCVERTVDRVRDREEFKLQMTWRPCMGCGTEFQAGSGEAVCDDCRDAYNIDGTIFPWG